LISGKIRNQNPEQTGQVNEARQVNLVREFKEILFTAKIMSRDDEQSCDAIT
jgi:hypothetical protein